MMTKITGLARNLSNSADLYFEISHSNEGLLLENIRNLAEVGTPGTVTQQNLPFALSDLVDAVGAVDEFQTGDLSQILPNNDMQGFVVAVFWHIGAVEKVGNGIYRLVRDADNNFTVTIVGATTVRIFPIHVGD